MMTPTTQSNENTEQIEPRFPPAGEESNPLVTILLASYNRLPELKKAIKSALRQDYPAIEIVIIDDGSNAVTQYFLRRLHALSKQIHVYFQNNQGPAAARANGIIRSSGEYICILDSDDILRKEAVSTIIKAFSREKQLDLVHVNNRKIYKNKVVGKSRYTNQCDTGKLARDVYLSPVVPFKHSGMAFRRETVLALGNYDPSLPRKIDIDMFLRFLTNGKKIKLLETPPLVDFVQNDDSISRSRLKGIQCWFVIINKYEKRLMFRIMYKTIRVASELGKMLVETIRYN
ncbi:MAG: glycosyltransferase family 2 protein [Deferribacteres bacterium]|nr:glycosyltransferase family 2 protein [candidate division KSB1 bacterium]MCB9501468.1 glycosyltransferase family 2 protein [Deferribacteres bacterium]